MKNARYEELIASYLSGEINRPDKEKLLAWVEETKENRAFFDEMAQLWKLAENFDVPYEANTEAAWNAVEKKLDAQIVSSLTPEQPTPHPMLKPVWGRITRIAAVGLVAILAAWWIFQKTPEPVTTLQIVQTQSGEQKEVLLPDGSRIWLNENTQLSYDANFEVRQVQLEGEAFFDVERMEDSPFEVVSGSTHTLVLGTSFNVRAYPTEEQVEVTVETGKVKFSEHTESDEQAVVLPAGTSGIYKKPSKELVKTETKLDNALSWRTQRLEFEDSPMRKVISDIERYFDVDIRIENESILYCPYTGDFSKPDLSSILEAISFALNDARFEKQPDGTYILIGEGCE